MSKAKQVIVARKDLNMPAGKLAAQVSHASLGAVLSLSEKDIRIRKEVKDGSTFIYNEKIITIPYAINSSLDKWLEEKFTKIVLECNSEEELELIYYKAKDAKLPTVLITDAGDTIFNGVPTKTCVAIGPADEEEINNITGKLKLYK